MPMLVHLTDAKSTASIVKGGIKLGKPRKVIFFMPVLREHFISHQWLRELRRRGARELAGVYFRLPDDELVFAARYNEAHRRMPLGEAIGQLMRHPDPLGYEIYIERKIDAKDIARVRRLPQKIGWRYMPHAHGRPLCGCQVCLPRGSIKSRALRQRLEPDDPVPSYTTLIQRLESCPDEDAIWEALAELRGKRRRSDPSFLQGLLDHESPEILEILAVTLGYFRHARSRELLRRLERSDVPDVRLAAESSLRQLGAAIPAPTR